ncbi:UNVERIFIED_CONTAM: hypothetical protein PYX00_007964 [Menopon gallinae]|uniref:Chromosome transmission fidelity protein 8 n=1 Tax=Menopon gallinae TaxID=328185 RepID=A0AAW2HL23_9NEOP
MIITIEPEFHNGKIREWGLIEFQGSFSNDDNDETQLSEVYIGDLNYTKDGIPFFINGHHILHGQEVKLQKPLAILCKDFEKEDCQKQYVVKALIRKKVIFKTRPKPIIPNEIPMNNS